MLAALLALAASVTYGTSDFIAGLESRRRSVWSVTAVSQPAALLVAGLLLALHWAPLTSPGYALAAVLGGVGAGIAVIAYYLALSSGTMSVVAPIVAVCALVPVLAGLAGGERVSLPQYAGMALALGGIVLSSRAEARGNGRAGLRSVAYAVIAAAGFGAMMVGLGIGGEKDVYWSVFGARVGSMAAIFAYLGVRRPGLDVPWRAIPALAAVGILGVIANALFTVASTMGYLSVVAVLATLAPVVIAAYARAFLQERLSPLQLGAAAVVLVGVVCLAVG